MNYLEAEKKLVQFLAGLLHLEPDQEIFAGNLPDGIPTGVTIDLESGIPAGVGQVNTFSVCVCGCFHSRTLCREKAFSITSALPVFGQSDLLSIRTAPDQPLVFSGNTPEGKSIYSFQLKLILTFI